MTFDELIQHLGLTPADDRHGYGLYRGCAIAVAAIGMGTLRGQLTVPLDSGRTAIVEAERPVYEVMFQIRHPLTQEELPPVETYAWGAALDRLIAQGQAKISIEERIAFLEVYDAENLADEDNPVGVLDAALDALAVAGVVDASGRCHYCRKNAAPDVKFLEGRVVQICTACLASRLAPAEPEIALPGSGALRLAVACTAGALIGAIAWVGFWIAYDALAEWMSEGRPNARVPIIFLVACWAIGGALMGGPIGGLIRALSRHGTKVTRIAGAVAALAAVVMGEVARITWIAYRQFDVFAPLLWARHLPRLWLHLGADYMFFRGIVAVTGVVIAYRLARPARKPLAV